MKSDVDRSMAAGTRCALSAGHGGDAGGWRSDQGRRENGARGFSELGAEEAPRRLADLKLLRSRCQRLLVTPRASEVGGQKGFSAHITKPLRSISIKRHHRKGAIIICTRTIVRSTGLTMEFAEGSWTWITAFITNHTILAPPEASLINAG